MSDAPVDPRWPKILSLSVHEFRTPLTVVAGYIRMLLKDRAGPLSDQQRRLLEEAEKSTGRLSALLSEVSDLSNLEAGTAPFNRSPLDLRPLLAEAIASLPAIPDRPVHVELSVDAGPAHLSGDAARLKTALTSVLAALRRELVSSDRLFVRERTRPYQGGAASWVAVADGARVERLSTADPTSLVVFDEWRGGCGLSLAVARRIISAHGGRIWSPSDESRAGAAILLPLT